MEDKGGLPEFLQHVHQIQNQSDMEFLVHSNLESTLTVGQGQARRGSRGIAAVHLFSHLLDNGGLSPLQKRPHPPFFPGWGGGGGTRGRGGGGEEAFGDLFGGAGRQRT